MKTWSAIWVGALIAVSLQPWRPHATAVLYQFHRAFHLAAFGLTALVLWRLFDLARGTALPPRFPSAAWIPALLATIALGGIIEVSQHLIYRNGMEWGDVRDDALSAIAAILLGHAARAAWTVRESL